MMSLQTGGSNTDEFKEAIKDNTKLIYLESPSTLIFGMQDLSAVSKIAKENDILTVIDNSWATPIFQKPHTLGIDIIIHSMSKYMGGHSDVISGVAAGSFEHIKRIARLRELVGSILGPMEAWLVIRGLRTLPLRMKEHKKRGMKVANWLENHPRVKKVFYPGLQSHPQYELGRKQMTGYSSPLSFIPDADIDECRLFVQRLKYYNVGPSWGGFESMISMPYGATDKKLGIEKGTIRIHVGLECINELIDDLDSSLNKMK